jgi:hypothetical protein
MSWRPMMVDDERQEKECGALRLKIRLNIKNEG